jgi:DNA polymerase (family 10)
VEVDILLDGTLDLADETLAQLDIVIASVHSGFNQTAEEVTARVLRACENPTCISSATPPAARSCSAKPTRSTSPSFCRCRPLGVAVEHNAAPARADLSDLNLRQAKELGCKIIVNTDAHSTDELDQIDDGIVQLAEDPDLLPAHRVEADAGLAARAGRAGGG